MTFFVPHRFRSVTVIHSCNSLLRQNSYPNPFHFYRNNSLRFYLWCSMSFVPPQNQVALSFRGIKWQQEISYVRKIKRIKDHPLKRFIPLFFNWNKLSRFLTKVKDFLSRCLLLKYSSTTWWEFLVRLLTETSDEWVKNFRQADPLKASQALPYRRISLLAP